MLDTARKRQSWLICLGLAAAILAVYGQLARAGFVMYDDPDYVRDNPQVRNGLTWAGVKWAFTTFHSDNWHPLTWISHMADAQLYGMNPGGHHLTNVALHLSNSILLFLLLQYLTSATWPSATVAALFALHPIHVESVAWISERKDVLSTLFWILTIWTYAAFVRGRGRRFYVFALLCYALGLMAKPMLVTLPFALLLLDYWPLQRQPARVSALLTEKIPFFVLTAISCAVTFLAQWTGGAVVPLAMRSLGGRLANVPVSYVRYVGKILWPLHLSITYPISRWSFWTVAGASALCVGITAWALWRARAQPWLAVGWLWFLGTLAPVIGVVQVGMQGMADRYSYIPSIGLFIAMVWAAREECARLGARVPAFLGALSLATCLVLAARQAAYWMDDDRLLLHAIHATDDNYLAYKMLALKEVVRGDTNAAIGYLQESVRMDPNYAVTRHSLGRLLLGSGQIDAALPHLQKAVVLDPTLAEARYDLGYAYLAKGRLGEALDQFQALVDLDPSNFGAQRNMGQVLLQNGLAADAAGFLQKAAALKPEDAEGHYLLGNALFRAGRTTEAVSQYKKSTELDPARIEALNDLAWILACDPDPGVRDGRQAVALASRADRLARGQNPVVIGTLAAGYAEARQFPDAIAASRRACEVAAAQTNAPLAESLQKRLKSYEAGQPWRNAAGK